MSVATLGVAADRPTVRVLCRTSTSFDGIYALRAPYSRTTDRSNQPTPPINQHCDQSAPAGVSTQSCFGDWAAPKAERPPNMQQTDAIAIHFEDRKSSFIVSFSAAYCKTENRQKTDHLMRPIVSASGYAEIPFSCRRICSRLVRSHSFRRPKVFFHRFVFGRIL